MTATVNERTTEATLGAPHRGTYPIAANTLIRKGWQVALNLAGYLVAADTIANGALFAVGKAEHTVDNRTGSVLGGAAGAADVEVGFGVHGWKNSAGADEITIADIGKRCFMADNQTVMRTSGGGINGPSGVISEVRNGLVYVFQSPAAGTHRRARGSILLSLHDFREVSSGGDVSNIAANGGILASDTTPIMRGDAAESSEIVWAAANADIIGAALTLPEDFDGSEDVTVELFVYTDNAGGGGIEAATFTVETSWDGGAVVVDTATDGTPAVALHKTTATIAAADVPNRPSVLTLMLTPGTHANDPVQLLGARISYATLP